MAVVTITQIDGEKHNLYRVELREGSDTKPMLSRRFREKHMAFGMAMAVGETLEIEPDLTIRKDTDEEGDC